MTASSPGASSPGDLIVRGVVVLGRALRDAGVPVGPSRVQDALLALATVASDDREQIYWALRCTLTSRREDLELFDEAFSRLREPEPPDQPDLNPGATPKPDRRQLPNEPSQGIERMAADQELVTDGDGEPEAAESGMRWSAVERLRELDFASVLRGRAPARVTARRAPREGDAAAALAPAAARRLRAGVRYTRRRCARRCAATAIRSFARGGLRPGPHAGCVFVVDVSGSMQPYARAMMMFLQAAVRAGRRVEAFTFGTRLTRVTRELAARNPDQALLAATRVVRDWAGGTRIGENLRTLNDDWGRRGLTRGAVVVIVSDGWERGDIDSLVDEMERLQRASHTVIWVNPLAGEPGYEPLAQGMAASLPYVDHFLPGHNLRQLRDAGRGARGTAQPATSIGSRVEVGVEVELARVDPQRTCRPPSARVARIQRSRYPRAPRRRGP